jgi:hypothetical protein
MAENEELKLIAEELKSFVDKYNIDIPTSRYMDDMEETLYRSANKDMNLQDIIGSDHIMKHEMRFSIPSTCQLPDTMEGYKPGVLYLRNTPHFESRFKSWVWRKFV